MFQTKSSVVKFFVAVMSPDKMKITSNGEDYIVSAYVVNSLSRKDIMVFGNLHLRK